MNFFKGMNFFTSNGESESEKNFFPKFRKKNSYTWQKSQWKAGGGGHWDVDFSNYQ